MSICLVFEPGPWRVLQEEYYPRSPFAFRHSPSPAGSPFWQPSLHLLFICYPCLLLLPVPGRAGPGSFSLLNAEVLFFILCELPLSVSALSKLYFPWLCGFWFLFHFILGQYCRLSFYIKPPPCGRISATLIRFPH